MSIADHDEPEYDLFFWTAMRAMEAYRKEHGHYPDKWHLLDIEFALPNYHITDTDIRPRREDGSVWRPRGCKWTYVIKNATASTVLLQSIGAQGKAEYEIEQGMTKPRRVVDGP